MREYAGQPAASASLARCRAAGCPALLALRCFCIAACAALCVALVPVGVGLSPATLPYVHKSEAYAIATNQPYASSFLTAAAGAAGLSESDFVLTCLQAMSIGTGYSYLNGEVSYGASDVNHTLELIIETAEYPDWDGLTEQQKNNWNGNESNYNAARFNSFMNAFGLSDARNTFYSSGGGNFGDNDKSKLERIGAIGLKWAQGVKESVENVNAVITNMRTSGYTSSLTLPSQVEMTDEVSNWPGGLSRTPVLNYGYDFRFYCKYYSQNLFTITRSSAPCVCLVGYDAAHRDAQCIVASSGPFQWTDSADGSLKYNAQSYTRNGKTVYYVGNSYTSDGVSGINVIPQTFTSGAVNSLAMAWNIVYGVDSGGVTLPDAPMERPEDIQYPGDYAGADKLGPDTSYPTLFGDEPGQPVTPPYTPPGPDERPQNPYNPSNPENPSYQSGTPEWKETTTENMQPLLNVRLDKLFPFCLLYDLNTLWAKVQGLMEQNGLSGQDYEDYLHIRFPIEMVSPDLGIYIEEQIEFDLTPVHDLLLSTKTAVFVLLIFMTLLSLIRFWQRILTGG